MSLTPNSNITIVISVPVDPGSALVWGGPREGDLECGVGVKISENIRHLRRRKFMCSADSASMIKLDDGGERGGRSCSFF